MVRAVPGFALHPLMNFERGRLEVQKIVDANEKLVKELKDRNK